MTINLKIFVIIMNRIKTRGNTIYIAYKLCYEFQKGRESDIMKLKSLAVLSMSAVVLTACGNDTPKDETKSTESNTNQDTNTTKDVIALKMLKQAQKML